MGTHRHSGTGSRVLHSSASTGSRWKEADCDRLSCFGWRRSVLLSLAISPSSILLWSIVISFFNLGAWSALYAYTPELYPTRVRGTGAGAAASIGRAAGVIAPTATPLLYAYGGLQRIRGLCFGLISWEPSRSLSWAPKRREDPSKKSRRNSGLDSIATVAF